ncbi:hypothetical protein ACET3Z_012106 [Daucus carota]
MLQFSLQPLCKLRSLILDFCDISHINVRFFPENLETLSIWNCNLPLPLDLPKLKYLRKLEIEEGRPGVQLVPNSIYNLPSLQELRIPNGFEDLDVGPGISWDAVSAPILVEISKFTGLKSLQMYFPDFEPFQDTNVFTNLLEYNICVGHPGEHTRYYPDYIVSSKKSIELYGTWPEILGGLIEKAEEVKLHGTDMNVSSIHNRNKKAFTDLRNLYIEECNTMEYLARISEDEICYSSQSQTSFCKLTTLEIKNCSGIKYLFNDFVAKSLVQLQNLYINSCPVMEAVIMNEGTSDKDIIFFSKLKSLELINLPRLKCFYKQKDMNSSATSILDKSVIPLVQPQPLFDGMVAFQSLEELFLDYMEDISEIWGKCYNDNVSSFSKLKRLKVDGCNKLETFIQLSMLHRLRNLECIELSYCDGLRNMFLPSIAKDLMHLKEMYLSGCKMMTHIIGAGEQEITDAIVFSELTLLNLECLPNLKSFCYYQSEEDNNYKASEEKVSVRSLKLFVKMPKQGAGSKEGANFRRGVLEGNLILVNSGDLHSYLWMSGNITYNGHGLKEFVPRRTSAYVSRQDWHVPEMTMRETLDFSARCQGVGCKYDMLEELARREKRAGIKPDEDLDIFMKASALGEQETSLIVEYILKGRKLPSGSIQHGLGQSQLNQGNQLNRHFNQFSSPANSALFNAAQSTPNTQMVNSVKAAHNHSSLHHLPVGYPRWIYQKQKASQRGCSEDLPIQFLNFPLKIKEHVKVASRSSSVNAFFNNTFAPFQLLKFCENQVLPSRSIAICFDVATFTNSKSELEEEILPLEQMKMEPITSS